MGLARVVGLVCCGALFLSGCHSGLEVTASDARASYFPPIAAERAAIPVGSEETSSEVRAIAFNAARDFLFKTGQYPIRSIKDSELLSLKSTNSGRADAGSSWDLIATIRLNYQSASSKIVELSIFERDGQLVVKKISV